MWQCQRNTNTYQYSKYIRFPSKCLTFSSTLLSSSYSAINAIWKNHSPEAAKPKLRFYSAMKLRKITPDQKQVGKRWVNQSCFSWFPLSNRRLVLYIIIYTVNITRKQVEKRHHFFCWPLKVRIKIPPFLKGTFIGNLCKSHPKKLVFEVKSRMELQRIFLSSKPTAPHVLHSEYSKRPHVTQRHVTCWCFDFPPQGCCFFLRKGPSFNQSQIQKIELDIPNIYQK